MYVYNGYNEAKTNRLSLRKNNITIVVGRNGYGKSSLLSGIDAAFKNNPNVLVVHWSDNEYGRGNAMDTLLWNDDIEGLASMAFHSEGQKMRESFGRFFLAKVGSAVRRINPEDGIDTAFLLVDQLDSGLDVHQINLVKQIFRDTIIPDMKSRGIKKVYVVMTANSYEMVRGEECIDPITRMHFKFDCAEDFNAYIDKQYGEDEE